MRVVVLGAGAVGSLFGARFARAGQTVTLVGRAGHVDAVRTRGLSVLDDPDFVVRPDATTGLPTSAEVDAVVLTVKTFDLEPTARALAEARPAPVPVLLTQNGLGVEEGARSALSAGGWPHPETWTVRAVHSVPATWVGPGVVRAAGVGEVLLPEPGSTPARAEHVRLFIDLFAGAGFAVRTVRSFDREVWRKVLVNAAINPVTAVRGVPNGELLKDPARAEALLLLREALEAARSAGFSFSEDETVREFERVARATAANRSSMLQDVERGRPTEIDAISGALVRTAAAHGVELPATRAIVERVRRRAAAFAPQPS